MRCWARLIRWAEDERLRPVFSSGWHRRPYGFARARPGYGAILNCSWGFDGGNKIVRHAAWAEHHYDCSFEQAMEFLDRSKEEHDRLLVPTRSANEEEAQAISVGRRRIGLPSCQCRAACLYRAPGKCTRRRKFNLPKMPSMRCCLPPEADSSASRRRRA